MSTSSKPAAEGEPGHYGAGYGEQVREDATGASPPPAVDITAPAVDITAPAGLEPIDRRLDPNAPEAADDAGAPVVFTSADVGARPPDHPPTEAAPESEKAALIFERS